MIENVKPWPGCGEEFEAWYKEWSKALDNAYPKELPRHLLETIVYAAAMAGWDAGVLCGTNKTIDNYLKK